MAGRYVNATPGGWFPAAGDFLTHCDRNERAHPNWYPATARGQRGTEPPSTTGRMGEPGQRTQAATAEPSRARCQS